MRKAPDKNITVGGRKAECAAEKSARISGNRRKLSKEAPTRKVAGRFAAGGERNRHRQGALQNRLRTHQGRISARTLRVEISSAARSLVICAKIKKLAGRSRAERAKWRASKKTEDEQKESIRRNEIANSRKYFRTLTRRFFAHRQIFLHRRIFARPHALPAARNSIPAAPSPKPEGAHYTPLIRL